MYDTNISVYLVSVCGYMTHVEIAGNIHYGVGYCAAAAAAMNHVLTQMVGMFIMYFR